MRRYSNIQQGRRIWRDLNTAFIFVEFSMDFRHHRLLRLVSYKMKKYVTKNPSTVNLCNVLRSVTSNIGLFKVFHKGYPECSRYILTLIWIESVTEKSRETMFIRSRQRLVNKFNILRGPTNTVPVTAATRHVKDPFMNPTIIKSY